MVDIWEGAQKPVTEITQAISSVSCAELFWLLACRSESFSRMLLESCHTLHPHPIPPFSAPALPTHSYPGFSSFTPTSLSPQKPACCLFSDQALCFLEQPWEWYCSEADPNTGSPCHALHQGGSLTPLHCMGAGSSFKCAFHTFLLPPPLEETPFKGELIKGLVDLVAVTSTLLIAETSLHYHPKPSIYKLNQRRLSWENTSITNLYADVEPEKA